MPVKGQITGKPAHNRLSLVDRKFTRLTVLEFVGIQPTGHRESLWKCRCDCGNEMTTTGYSLTSGNTKSCGCYHKIRTRQLFSKPISEIRVNRIFYDYRKRAKQKNMDITLTKEQFKTLMDSDCHYCGGEPSNSLVQHEESLPVYQGIDRKDNSEGYTPDNVVPCCIVCNKMKKTMSHDDFLLHIHRISTRFMADIPQTNCFESVEVF